MVDSLRGCLVLLNKCLIDGRKHLMELRCISTKYKTDTVVEIFCNLEHTWGDSIFSSLGCQHGCNE